MYMVFSIDSDVCFYPEEQNDLVRHLKAADVPHHRITVHTDKGHDSFLLEPRLSAPHLVDTLTNSWHN
jgi:homoserine O-acetyltransferase